MKRIIMGLVFTLITLIAGCPITLAASNPTVYLDGRQLYFDVPAQIINGRTMVPMRAIFEELSADVGWDGATRTVLASKDSVSLEMTIGSTTYYENGTAKNMDVPAQIVNGRTLVPLRLVAECMRCMVDYNGGTNVVTIQSTNQNSSGNQPVNVPAQGANQSGDRNTQLANSIFATEMPGEISAEVVNVNIPTVCGLGDDIPIEVTIKNIGTEPLVANDTVTFGVMLTLGPSDRAYQFGDGGSSIEPESRITVAPGGFYTLKDIIPVPNVMYGSGEEGYSAGVYPFHVSVYKGTAQCNFGEETYIGVLSPALRINVTE